MMAGNDVELDTPEKRQQVAELALKDEGLLEHLIELLCGKSRLKRQKAASIVAIISNEDAMVLLPYAEDICEALNHTEAQTRWEVLHTLDQMGKVGQRYDEDTLALAEDALYDENNGIVREAAFRFLCGYGSASPENSNEVWPLIDETIQCFHGNDEFCDMLTHLVEFAQGNISMETSGALAMRMKFDSETASGTLRMRSEQIVDAYTKRGGELKDLDAKSAKKADSDDGDDFGD